MTSWSDVPAGARAELSAVPAGDQGEQERAAQREAWRRVQASYRRTVRGSTWRRRAARGTLPARAGMIRRMPPEPDGDDAA